MGDRIWFHSFLEPSDERTAAVRTMLDRAGIEATGIESTGHDATVGAGALLLASASVSEPLLSFLCMRSCGGQVRIICLTCETACAPRDACRLLSAGCADVLPITGVDGVGVMVAARLARWREIDAIVESLIVGGELVGSSPAWRALLRIVVETARYTEASVLLTGATGTGKELIAHLVHELDRRPDKSKFVILDCTTIVPDLSGSEFFGHERGAFTGAITQRDGAFAAADHGTLFLDEIGELPPPLQAQLLRVIQEGTYKRVGGNTWYCTRFRLICATHRDLADLVRQGRFRADLYFRLAGVPIHLPLLQERGQDVLSLARHFVSKAIACPMPPDLDSTVANFLLMRDYPGNVRELRQLVTRMIHRWAGVGPLTVGCLPDSEWSSGANADTPSISDGFAAAVRQSLAAGLGLRDLGRTAEDIAFRLVLDEEGGNLQRAARRLGVTDRALQLRCQAQRRTFIAALENQTPEEGAICAV